MSGATKKVSGGGGLRLNRPSNERTLGVLRGLYKTLKKDKEEKEDVQLGRGVVQKFLAKCSDDLYEGVALVPCVEGKNCPDEEDIAGEPYSRTYTARKVEGKKNMEILRCVPPSMRRTYVNDSDGETDDIQDQIIEAIGGITSKIDNLKQMVSNNMNISCDAASTRALCEGLQDDGAQQCVFTPFEKDDGGNWNASREDTSSTSRDPLDVGKCKPSPHFLERKVKRDAALLIARQKELDRLRSSLSTGFQDVKPYENTPSIVPPELKQRLREYLRQKNRRDLLEAQVAAMRRKTSTEFRAMDVGMALGRAARATDRICVARTTASSPQDECIQGGNMCVVVDPTDGKQTVSSSDPMGRAKCLSATGENRTWVHNSTDKSILRLNENAEVVNRTYGSRFDQYWDAASGKVAGLLGYRREANASERRAIEDSRNTVLPLVNKLVVLQIQLADMEQRKKNASEDDKPTEEDIELLEKEIKRAQNDFVKAIEATKRTSPVALEQISELIQNLTGSASQGTGYASYLDALNGAVGKASLVSGTATVRDLRQYARDKVYNRRGGFTGFNQLSEGQLVKVRPGAAFGVMQSWFTAGGWRTGNIGAIVKSIESNTKCTLKVMPSPMKPTITEVEITNLADIFVWPQGPPKSMDTALAKAGSLGDLDTFKAITGLESNTEKIAKGKMLQGAPTVAIVDKDVSNLEGLNNEFADLASKIQIDPKYIAALKEAYNPGNFTKTEGNVTAKSSITSEFRDTMHAAESTAAKEEMMEEDGRGVARLPASAHRLVGGGSEVSLMSTDDEASQISLMSTEVDGPKDFDIDEFYEELYGKKLTGGGATDGGFDEDEQSVSELSASEISAMSTNIESLLSEHSF